MRKSIPMIDSTKTPARRPWASSQTHRNEFPAGYSLASCSPAELASAFPTNAILQQSRLSVEQISADGSCLTSLLSQKGPQSIPIFLLIVLSAFLLVPWLGQDFFPAIDSGQMLLHVRAKAGTRIEETARLCDLVEASIRREIPS